MKKKKILLGLGSAIAIATPVVTIVACGGSAKPTTPTQAKEVPPKEQGEPLKEQAPKGIEISDLIGLMGSGGIFSLPTYLTKDELSIEAIIDELAKGEKSLLIQQINQVPNVTLPTTQLAQVMTYKDTILKLIDQGLQAFDNNDINNVKMLIKDFVGDKYVGPNKLLDALVNGVEAEVVKTDGALTVLPKLVREFVEDIVNSIITGEDEMGIDPKIFQIAQGVIDQYLNPITEKFFGTWEKFLTDTQGLQKKVDELKFDSLTQTPDLKAAKLKMQTFLTKAVADFNKYWGDTTNPYLNSMKLILSNHQSVNQPSRKTLSSLEYMKTLNQFKGFEIILDNFNLEANKPLFVIAEDNFLDSLKVIKKLTSYFNNNWQKIIQDEFMKEGQKVTINDELKTSYKMLGMNDPETQSTYPTLLNYLVEDFPNQELEFSWTMYDLNNIQFMTSLKEAIKKNQAILGQDLLSVSPLANKSILETQTATEFQKTLAYLQAILQRTIVYTGYEGQENTLRDTLGLLGEKSILAFDILGSSTILKLATIDLTKSLSSNMFDTNDFKFMANLINNFLPVNLQIHLTANDLQGIFTILVDGFKVEGQQRQNFEIVISKILKIVPNLPKDIISMALPILFGN